MTQGQAHLPRSSGHDTINTTAVPVILVPGVMGTRLDLLGAGPRWDPDDTLAMLNWAALGQRRVAQALDANAPCAIMLNLSPNALSDIRRNPALRRIAARSLPPGTRSTLGQVYADRGWGSVAWAFYGPILIHLEERLNLEPSGTVLRPVYAAGYDFRQSNRDSGLRLLDRIREILDLHPSAERAIIVSHSMGGLVTRSALLDGADSLLVGVVHTVMPSDGAAVAYRRFQTGATNPFDGGFFNIPARVLNGIMGSTRLEYAVTQARLRGPLELLPGDTYPEAFVTFTDGRTNRNITDIFGVYERQDVPGVVPRAGEQDPDTVVIPPGPVPGQSPFVVPGFRAEQADVDALRANLRRSRNFLRFLNRSSPNAHPNTIVLLGNAERTDLHFDWTVAPSGERRGFRDKIRQATPGDGTVPAASAEFRNASPLPIERRNFAVEHAACFANAGFRQAVEAATRRLLARAGVFPQLNAPPPPAAPSPPLDGGLPPGGAP